MPVRTGKLTLPPVHYSHEGRDYQTQALTVEVVKGSLNPRPASPAHPSQPLDDDFFAAPFQNRQPQTVDARLRAVISKQDCFKDEQLLFRILLYTRNRIEAVNMVSSPSFAGFWQEWFPVPQSISAGSENVNGVIYQVYEIRKAALFANESGTLTIPALQFELQLADPASMFFGSKPVRRSTQPIKIHVNPLPAAAAGLPVGQFSFSVSCPQLRADSNDIVTLQMRISGSGNSKTIIPPAFQNDESIQVYPAKISQENTYNPLALTGTVRAEIPVAFNKAGKATFPSLEFRYFDPASRSHGQPAQPTAFHRSQRRKAETGQIDDLAPQRHRPKRRGHRFHQKRPHSRPIRLFLPPGLVCGSRGAAFCHEPPFFAEDQPLAAIHRRQSLAEKPANPRPDPAAPGPHPAVRRHRRDFGILLREKSGLGFAEISNQKIGELLAPAPGPGRQCRKSSCSSKARPNWRSFPRLKKPSAELKNDLQALRALLREIDKKLK